MKNDPSFAYSFNERGDVEIEVLDWNGNSRTITLYDPEYIRKIAYGFMKVADQLAYMHEHGIDKTCIKFGLQVEKPLESSSDIWDAFNEGDNG